MSCPAIDRLAAAASGEDAAATEHALVCVPCRDAIVEQQAMILAVRQSPGFALDPARRRAIAAELATRSDEPMTVRSPRFAIAVSVACAAALALVIAASTTRQATEPPPRTRDVAAKEPGAPGGSSAPSTPPPRVAASPRAPVPAADAPADPRAVMVIALAQHVAEAPALITRATRIDVFDLARSFAPSKPAPAHATVESEDLYVAPPPDQDAVSIVDDPDPPASIDAGTSSSSASLAAFRTGWEALRADRYADAIAAFDTATDPVVAEDAAFWAAIAAERAHDEAAAARRLRGFLARFPNSPRADAARAALARVGH